MRREWGGGARVGNVYRFNRERDAHRLGSDQVAPRDGALCLCVEHAGDCFYRYRVLNRGGFYTWSIGHEFGAYVFGDDCGSLDERAYHMLLAGSSIACDQIEYMLESLPSILVSSDGDGDMVCDADGCQRAESNDMTPELRIIESYNAGRIGRMQAYWLLDAGCGLSDEAIVEMLDEGDSIDYPRCGKGCCS